MSRNGTAVSDYKLLFEKLGEGVAQLEGDVTIRYRQSVELSEEIEALRAITEEVNAAEHAGFQSITLG